MIVAALTKLDFRWISGCCLRGVRELIGNENNPSTGIRWGFADWQYTAEIVYCPWCGVELPKEVPDAQAL